VRRKVDLLAFRCWIVVKNEAPVENVCLSSNKPTSRPPYVPIHFAFRNRTVGNSKPLHVMPRRKIECLGDRRPPAMVEHFALASYELNLMVA
jgi:hypothetical protein